MWSVLIIAGFVALVAGPTTAAVIDSPGGRNITLTKLKNPGGPNARAYVDDYYYSNEETDYFTAVDICNSYSLRILQEKTSTKQLEVSRVLGANQVEEPVWLGLTDINVDGTWKWYDGSGLNPQLAKTNWAENNGGMGEDDCSILDPETYKWSERSCKGSCTMYRFICEPLNA